MSYKFKLFDWEIEADYSSENADGYAMYYLNGEFKDFCDKDKVPFDPFIGCPCDLKPFIYINGIRTIVKDNEYIATRNDGIKFILTKDEINKILDIYCKLHTL